MSGYLYPDSALMVFAKTPKPGHVKTRMQPVLSEQQSAQLHQQMIEHVLEEVLQSTIAPVQLWVGSEADYWDELRERFPVSLHIQQGDDLGQRLTSGFESTLGTFQRALVIGTDCPFINAAYLQQAFDVLHKNNDCVIGPAFDGGYVMIGLSRLPSEFFSGIEWGSGRVLEQTRQTIQRLQLTHSELSMLNDIDRPTDLKHLAVLPDFKRWLSFAPC